MLTRGTFQNFDFAKTCVAALELKTVTFVVPIVSDLSFEFPDPSFCKSLEERNEFFGDKASEAYKAIFNILALR